MKKILSALLLFCLLSTALFSAAAAETTGFGFVNADNVALRKTPGGQKLIRLPKNNCVWIKGEKTDGKGERWYEVNAEYNDEGAYRNRSGWIKAEFVDAGGKLWYDVKSIVAERFGMIVLRNDGTVESAGSSTDQHLRNWYTGRKKVRQAGLSPFGWTYYALDTDGRLWLDDGTTNEEDRFRLISSDHFPFRITEDNRLDGAGEEPPEWVYKPEAGDPELRHVEAMENYNLRLMFLMDDGTVRVADFSGGTIDYPEPDWSAWTDIASLDACCIRFGAGQPYHAAFAAVRKDGTVLAAPGELAALVGSWTEIQKIVIGADWVLGLKRDGTVVSAGTGGAPVPDVSGWTGIIDLGTGGDYCAGVKEDGTVVFAGEYVFTE